jgi:NADPH-dependent curcumin reductase CurA
MEWKTGDVPSWQLIGLVQQSKSDNLKVGSYVKCFGKWQLYNSISATDCEVLNVGDGILPEHHMSVLGGVGTSSYLPIKKYWDSQFTGGQTAYVSGAAGAVGLVTVQVLKSRGCIVLGSAGSDEKVAYLESLGVTAFNYKKEGYLTALERLCPNGLDFYWDNVGGESLEAAIEVMNDYGQIMACGAISQYDTPADQRYGVRNLFHIVAKRINMQGFINMPGKQFSLEDMEEAKTALAQLVKEGIVKDRYTAIDGFGNLPKCLLGLLSGSNTGKMMCRVPEAAPALD